MNTTMMMNMKMPIITDARAMVLCTALAVVSSAAAAGDWPQFMGPDRNHISKETDWAAPHEKPNLAWQAEVGVGYAGVSVADGRAFTLGYADKQETVWCFDAGTGKVLWKHTYKADPIPTFHRGGPNTAPTIEGDRVYTLSKDGQLFAFEAATGKILWRANLYEVTGLPKMTRWGFSSASVIDGENLLLHSNRPVAFDKHSGKLQWAGDMSAKPGYSSVVPFDLNGKSLMAAMTGDALTIYDRTNGKTVASHPFPIQYDMHAITPTVTAGPIGSVDIFIACANKGGRCEKVRFDGKGFKTLWSNENLRNFMNNSVLVDGHLYGFDGKHKTRLTKLVCMDHETGKVKWTQDGLGCGAAIVSNGKLIVLSEDGRILVAPLSSESFTPTVEHRILEGTCWTPPSLADGRIYARNEDGRVVCLDWRRQ